MLSTEDRREKRLQAPACFGAVKAVSCPLLCFFFPPQVDEIYHDESLGVHINIVLVRMIMVGYRQVRYLVSQQPCPAVLQPWGITVGFSRWNGLGRVSTGTFLLVSQVAFFF